ncbi:ribonuclease HI [Blattabacterium cuenoti]|uniref:ribonuclease HI n=1 Tax=Blattabacterium cuenoti TaxID=1653831 RepID=UPI00163BFFBD|nr:ribonuclease H [Blattabacterium cuenoti]
MNKIINIYTDGSSKGNPGPGGYSVFIEKFFGYSYYRNIIYEGFRCTTNNRMELLAVITGLKNIRTKKNTIIVFTDSKYIINAVNNKWIYEWEKNNFYKKKNIDLWKLFLKFFTTKLVFFHWIKSHNNHYINEFCDKLSTMTYKNNQLKIDYNYEKLMNKK